MLDVIAQLIGWIGSAVLVISLLQRRMKRLRIINLIAAGALVDAYFLIDGARRSGTQEASPRLTTAAIEPGSELGP